MVIGVKFLLIYIPLLTVLSASPVSAAEQTPLKITMVLWRGETNAEQGFKDGLTALGYQVNYQVLNARQDRSKLAKQLRSRLQQLRTDSDYVYSFGTTASQMVKQILNNSTPHIFNIVTDPVGADIVESWQHPGGNLTGTSNRLPLELQLDFALKFKRIHRIGFFFNPRERNSELTFTSFQQLASNRGMEVIELRCPPNTGRLEHYLEQLSDNSLQLDAVYLPLDSYLLTHAESIGKALSKGKVFSIGAQKDYIRHGVSIGIVPDYYHLGRVAAGYIHRHKTGESLAEIPIYQVKNPQLLINETTRRQLGLDIPTDLLSNTIYLD